VVGGLAVLSAIAGVLFFCLRKRQQTRTPSYTQTQRMEPPPNLEKDDRDVGFQGTQAPIHYLEEHDSPIGIHSWKVHGDY
jgi:hypothetical protein